MNGQVSKKMYESFEIDFAERLLHPGPLTQEASEVIARLMERARRVQISYVGDNWRMVLVWYNAEYQIAAHIVQYGEGRSFTLPLRADGRSGMVDVGGQINYAYGYLAGPVRQFAETGMLGEHSVLDFLKGIDPETYEGGVLSINRSGRGSGPVTINVSDEEKKDTPTVEESLPPIVITITTVKLGEEPKPDSVNESAVNFLYGLGIQIQAQDDRLRRLENSDPIGYVASNGLMIMSDLIPDLRMQHMSYVQDGYGNIVTPHLAGVDYTGPKNVLRIRGSMRDEDNRVRTIYFKNEADMKKAYWMLVDALNEWKVKGYPLTSIDEVKTREVPNRHVWS